MTAYELPQIKNKMDWESAAEIVAIGWPANDGALEELLAWSCFPNDLVCWVTYPYISSLRDAVLAPAMARFLAFHHNHGQDDLVTDAFWLFINDRGETFRALILAQLTDPSTRALFALPAYSLAQHAQDRQRFESVRAQSQTSQADPINEDTRDLRAIQDASDLEGVRDIVITGYPCNAARLASLIYWACQPGAPVAEIAATYLCSLRDEPLATAMANFIETCLASRQIEQATKATSTFIDARGADFLSLVASHMPPDVARQWLSAPWPAAHP